MTEVIQFSNLSHILISLIGAILLLAIYYNIKREYHQLLEEDDSRKRVDKGLLYISLAMFVWVASGSWAFGANYFGFENNHLYFLGVNLLSIANNMFLLLALYYFYYAPSFIYKNEKNVRLIVAMIIFTTGCTIALFYLSNDLIVNNIKISAIPDLLLSAFLSYLLLVSLYKTFIHRGLKLVALISTIVIALIFYSQLPEVFLSLNNDFSNALIKIIAKTSLISIFLVLATTWVIQLANTPRITEMQIQFIDWNLIKLSIPSKQINHAIVDFGSKTTQYKNLLKFAIRRKYGSGPQLSILVSSGGEIKNQTYLSRIIDNINEILALKDNQKIERKDLLTFIGEGKYRLRLLPEHIKIDGNLLSEFCNSEVESDYHTLCN